MRSSKFLFHVKPLRTLSPRPELVVDQNVNRVADPQAASVGIAGPFGRERCVYALPTGGVGAQQYAAAQMLRDQASTLIADPASNVIGQSSAVWISRLLFARWTEDTRR